MILDVLRVALGPTAVSRALHLPPKRGKDFYHEAKSLFLGIGASFGITPIAKH